MWYKETWSPREVSLDSRHHKLAMPRAQTKLEMHILKWNSKHQYYRPGLHHLRKDRLCLLPMPEL